MSSRKRSISSLINEDTSKPSRNPQTKLRKKVICNCTKCNGSLVDYRTKNNHESRVQQSPKRQSSDLSFSKLALSSQEQMEGPGSSQDLMDEVEEVPDTSAPVEDEFSLRSRTRNPALNRIMSFNEDYESSAIEEFEAESALKAFDLISAEHGDFDETHEGSAIVEFESDSALEAFGIHSAENSDLDKTPDVYSEDDSFSENSTDPDEISDDDNDIFEDYSAPDFEVPPEADDVFIDDRFTWILLWIMNFRILYNISESAIEVLLKFIKLVLIVVGGTEFNNFSASKHKVNKALGLSDKFVSFVACPKCHKLYKEDEVIKFKYDNQASIMRCIHIEFPNSGNRKRRTCDTNLSTQSKLSSGKIVNRPELVFPYSPIRHQLANMYQRPGFENSLRHWVDRSSFDDILCDIYNGEIWKTFKDDPFDENSALFFGKETADSHLGLIVNLDWFQPFDSVSHSTGVLYASIANLPRDIRFKRENMLVLGILPGPDEVSLHKINHYLSPVVDELESLWSGVTLTSTAEFSEGRTIRAALILISCDLPATRKLCGHISALVSCHRCKKSANYVNRHFNFGGMQDMDEWFIQKDLTEHRQKALE